MISEGIAIVPAAKSVDMIGGEWVVGSRIVVTDADLRPLADVLAEEIRLLTGRQMLVVEGDVETRDIVLAVDQRLEGEAYMLEVNETALVRGGHYDAVALGSVSLLQAMVVQDGVVKVPRMVVADEPFAFYRGLMVDLARKWHTLTTVKKMVVMCRWYKIRYLQLHLTDDQSCVFLSETYPKVATSARHYTLDELRELEAFARDRGVAITPELESPGHSNALCGALPSLNCVPEGGAMCPGKETTYEVLDKLIEEMSGIFQTTPYFHIGCDEVDIEGWNNCADCQAYQQKHGLDNAKELYRHFIVRMNEVVKKHGKKTIVWEGFHKEGKVDIPRDITVMIFECLYNLPPDLIRDGYSVINTSWQPIYVVDERAWTPEYIYGWNLYRWENWWEKSAAFVEGIEVAPTRQVLGAQMCTWQQADEVELPSLRERLPAMSERIWNPDAACGFENFAARLSVTDAALTKLL